MLGNHRYYPGPEFVETRSYESTPNEAEKKHEQNCPGKEDEKDRKTDNEGVN